MKSFLLAVSSVLFVAGAFAGRPSLPTPEGEPVLRGRPSPTIPAAQCSYELDREEYWENASGKLTLNGVEYRCEQQGETEDFTTVCLDPATQATIDLRIAFDGAEADFFVFSGSSEEPVCRGIATNK